jgi:two-component system KDP operon response regulator KdpE
VLARSAGRVVDAPVLLKEVWGPAYGTETHYLRVFIAQLRRKLEPDPAHPVSLLTETGRGYRLMGSD